MVYIRVVCTVRYGKVHYMERYEECTNTALRTTRSERERSGWYVHVVCEEAPSGKMRFSELTGYPVGWLRVRLVARAKGVTGGGAGEASH